MNLRARLGMFVLTRQEQRAIAFIVLMLVLGLATRHYRHRHPKSANSPNETVRAVPTPTLAPAKNPP
ncbi:MAG TPA: hypothetical protein VNW28_07155 [Chthoniobacterales bacterium]|nr:hypothetical protein [Chthoniobacterales bacterium]